MTKNTQNVSDPDAKSAEHITGAHLAAVLGADPTDSLSRVVGRDCAGIIVDWQRDALDHGRYRTDPNTGKWELDPWVEDVPVIPVDIIAEVLQNHGASVPTRQEVRAFADGGEIDPEIELLRARYVTDPDLDAAASPSEKRICGVPESIYDGLTTAERQKVLAGKVIAPPQSPTAVAHWLARHTFSAPQLLPAKAGTKRRRKVRMRTLIRINQTWYSYENAGAKCPPRWLARTDPEWMRARLRAVLGDLWYVKVKTRTIAGIETHHYSLKWWNPDTRTLSFVEDALADELTAGSGTYARELPDLYGVYRGIYAGGTRVLVRNGVLDVTTGQVIRNTPLWFSLTRIEADYDHVASPLAALGWLRVLDGQWHDDPGAVACLQQWFGYVVSGRTDLHKIMWLFGPPGSAKSLIAAVLEALVGNVTELGLDALNATFGLQQPYESGATLAVMSDMRFGARDSSLALSRLLAISGDDLVDVACKYKVAVKERLPLRFHGTANEMPKLSDHSGALVDRLLLLETSRAFKRGAEGTDAGLKERIIADELGLVLRWAVEGLAQLDAAGGRFTTGKDAAELVSAAADTMSNVRQFVNDCCMTGAAEDSVDMDALFRVWRRWAQENKSGERMSKAAFTRALKSLGVEPIKPGQKYKGPRVVWGIKRAATNYTHPDRFGHSMVSTESTDASGDPIGRQGAA